MSENPALTALRLLVQQHDDRQFLKPEQQHAWFVARQIVDEADQMQPQEAP